MPRKTISVQFVIEHCIYVAVISLPLYITWNSAIVKMIPSLEEASYFRVIGLALFVTCIADIFYVIFKSNYNSDKKL
jgi:hypothetical protein